LKKESSTKENNAICYTRNKAITLGFDLLKKRCTNHREYFAKMSNAMPQFSANLSLLFKEYPLIDRFSAAKNAGFDAVEIQFPYELTLSKFTKN
jgi:hypothetical protein